MEPSMKILLTLLCIGICTKTCFAQSFTAFAKTCSDCDVTNNAICEQKTGYVVCSCPAGSIGDGHKCTKQVYCSGYNCCPKGYNWDLAGKKCLDINECSSTSLNKCSPSGTCQNMKGAYMCTNINKAPCPLAACPDNKDCLTISGNTKCADPCTNYLQLNGDARLFTINSTGKFLTDQYNIGWYRYTGNIAVGMKEGCVGALKCGSLEPYSLGGPHPAIVEGVKMVPLLINGINGCSNGSSIPVKACPGGFYIYKLTGMLKSDVYCTEAEKPPTTTTPTTTTPATSTPAPTTYITVSTTEPGTLTSISTYSTTKCVLDPEIVKKIAALRRKIETIVDAVNKLRAQLRLITDAIAAYERAMKLINDAIASMFEQMQAIIDQIQALERVKLSILNSLAELWQNYYSINSMIECMDRLIVELVKELHQIRDPCK